MPSRASEPRLAKPCRTLRRDAPCRSRRSPATGKALVSPAARLFLEQLTPALQRDLWDEIHEIGADPLARGIPYPGDDPEFFGQRIALGVAGFGIQYLPMVGGGAYVISIRPEDFP